MNDENLLFSIIKKKGKQISVLANTYLSLQKENTYLYIESGSVNLFSIELKNNLPEGPRTLFDTFLENSLLFPIKLEEKQNHIELYIITEGPVTYWEIDAKTFENEIKNSPAIAPQFTLAIRRWIHQLTLILHKKDKHSHNYIVPSEEETLIEKESVFGFKPPIEASEADRLIWVEVVEGALQLLNRAPFFFNAGENFFPLTNFLWLKATENTRIRTHKTIDLIQHNCWKKHLSYFHQKLLEYFLFNKQRNEELLSRRIQKKIVEEEEDLSNAFKDMVSLINPEGVTPFLSSKEPILQAFLLLGKKMRIPFSFPPNLPNQENYSTYVSAICNHSSVRYREVRLKKLWWEEDAGPLLGFYGEQNSPVVLLFKKRRYYMVDPVTLKKVAINKEIDHEISATVFLFYRTFPAQLSTTKEVIRFYLKNNYREFFPILLFSTIGSILSLFTPFATAFIFSYAIPYADLSLLSQLIIGMGVTSLCAILFFYFRTLGLVKATGSANFHLQLAIWDRLLRLPVSFFRQCTTGDLIEKATSFEEISRLMSDYSARVLLGGIFSLFYLIAMFIYSPFLTFVSLALFIATLLATLLCAHCKLKASWSIGQTQGTLNGALIQTITGVAKLRVAGAENNAFRYWAQLFTKLKKLELKALTIQNIATNIIATLPIFSYFIIFGGVIHLLEAEKIGLGAFLGFNAAFFIFSASLMEMNGSILQMVPIPTYWKNIKEILTAPQEKFDRLTPVGKLSGDISIDDLSFRYEKEGALILNSLSFNIAPKELIGIVGPSGCGKSTLVRLLLGFETPELGTIYYDGKDLSSLNLHEIRRQLGVVMQSDSLIAGTLYENLVCGGVYSDQQIEYSLKLSGFIRDLEEFPMGLHTVIPMGADTLSAGQKQRLLIARALLPQPNILIFDEATSALDNKGQEEISNNIESLDVTRIVIAHRLSSIRNADRIYVLQKGSIIQSGTFNELAEQPGLFATMLKHQKL